MKRLAALAFALAAAACTASAPRPLTAAEVATFPQAHGMPADVQSFMVSWSDCSHWLGEHGWDARRQRQIDRAVRAVCSGIDARAERLRARHAGDPEVIARLAGYEPLGQ